MHEPFPLNHFLPSAYLMGNYYDLDKIYFHWKGSRVTQALKYYQGYKTTKSVTSALIWLLQMFLLSNEGLQL